MKQEVIFQIAIFILAVNAENAAYFGLSNLYTFGPKYYIVIMILMSIVEVVEAIMFYIIVKILHDKKLTGVKYNWKKWALIFLVRRPKMAEVSDQNDWNLSSKLAEKILIKISGIAVAVLLTGNTGAVYFIKMGI